MPVASLNSYMLLYGCILLNGQTRSDLVWPIVSPLPAKKNSQAGSDRVCPVKKNAAYMMCNQSPQSQISSLK